MSIHISNSRTKPAGLDFLSLIIDLWFEKLTRASINPFIHQERKVKMLHPSRLLRNFVNSNSHNPENIFFLFFSTPTNTQWSIPRCPKVLIYVILSCIIKYLTTWLLYTYFQSWYIGWQTSRGHNRWLLVDKRGDFSWTLLSREVLFLGEFSWTFLVNFRGHFFNSNEKSYTIIKQ